MPEFLETNVDLTRNFIRGAARLVIADLTMPVPVRLSDVIRTTTAGNQSEAQTVTITGIPTGGTFTLAFKGYTTGAIAYNAIASAVQTALQAISSIGTNGATVAGGPGPATPYVITFAGALANQNLPSMSAVGSFTGGTSPAIAVTTTTPGQGQYDAQANWQDLGATKGGITVLRNNAEETFSVDQIQADIYSMPTSWEMSVSTQVAQADIDTIQYVWEGGTITIDGTTGERTLPLGTPTGYRQKRLVVLFQRQSMDGGVTLGFIRAYNMRLTQRSPQESTIVHSRDGDQVSVPFTWKCLADGTVVDPNARFGGIIDQA